MGEREWQRYIDDYPESSGPSANPLSSRPDIVPGSRQPETAILAKQLQQLIQEGGVEFMQYLLAKAISQEDTLPDPSRI
jgi:hypothetical protein